MVKMKFDSIKSRLVLMTLVCILGMATLVVSQHRVNVKLLSLSQQKDLLHELSVDLLQLRRHEKDFLLRGSPRYIVQFNERMEQFTAKLVALEPLYSKYELDMNKTEELAQTIQRYEDLFKEVVYIYRVIGLSANQGLRDDFSKVVSKLEGMANSDFAIGQLAKAKAAQTEFLLNFNSGAKKQFETALNSLSPSNFSHAESEVDLARMSALFVALSDSIQKMGETESEGLKGEFRRQAHLVESRLANIEERLQPVIQEQGEKLRARNLFIALGTCAVMILILVKSFATFHRAFSYFVMFFYQCKREFHRIDPKKLGFAEFKSLAELANEMVETRKQAELEIEELKRQIREREGI
jgi:hypothetical protein